MMLNRSANQHLIQPILTFKLASPEAADFLGPTTESVSRHHNQEKRRRWRGRAEEEKEGPNNRNYRYYLSPIFLQESRNETNRKKPNRK